MCKHLYFYQTDKLFDVIMHKKESLHLLDSLVDELPLGRDQLHPVLSRLVEEARVNFGLFVLEGNIAGKNKGILDALRHVGVSRTVVHHNTWGKQQFIIYLLSTQCNMF